MRGLLVVVAAVTLGGCRVDDTRHTPLDDDGGTDAGADPIDAPPGQPAIVVAPGPLGVGEGNATSLGVRLSAAPTGMVTVTYSAGGAGSGLAFTPASLVFTPASWSADQPIFIDALEDDDAADSQKVIVLSAAGHTGATVPISITDNDELGLFVTPPALDVTEGRTGKIQISLTAAPATTTTITLSSSSGAATVAPSSLMFTSTTWNQIQTAIVTGVDDGDVVPGAAVVTAAAPGMLSVDVAITVTDDDVLAITPSTTSLTIGEGQASTSFTVALTQLPPSAMTVTLMSSDPSVRVMPSTLTFTTMAAQAVTISSVADPDTADEAATVTLHGSLPGVADRTVAVAVNDDDVQAIVAAPTALTALERGAPVTFDVRLAYQPDSSATVALATLGSTRLSLDHPTLTFTAADYAIAQRVTVTPLSDPDLATSTVPIVLSCQDAPADVTVAVAITDADRQTLIATPTQRNVDEGAQATLAVNLGFVPSGTVTVTATSGSPLLGLGPTALTFDATTWSTPQAITLTAQTDADTADLETTVTWSGAAAPLTTVVPVTIVDQTVTDLIIAPSVRAIPESGTATFVVTLTAQPSAPVIGTITTSAAAIATAAPTTFTLDAGNWSSGVLVTVTGVHDPDVSDDTATITFAAGAASHSVTANVIDDDEVQVVVSATTVAVPEGGGATIDVTLSVAPDANTTVTITAPAGVALSTATLAFNSSDWSSPHPVVLTAVRDDDTDLGTTAVTFTPSPDGVAATVTVTESVDHTIVTGWPVAVGDPGERSIPSLHAWLAPSRDHDGAATLPACAQIDAIYAIGKSPSAGTVQVGMYAPDHDDEPDARVLDSGVRTLQPGVNRYTFTNLELCAGAPSAFLAARSSSGASLGFAQLGSSIPHCTRGGGGMPSSFGSGGTVCGSDDQPVAVWIVMHAKAACSCTPP